MLDFLLPLADMKSTYQNVPIVRPGDTFINQPLATLARGTSGYMSQRGVPYRFHHLLSFSAYNNRFLPHHVDRFSFLALTLCAYALYCRYPGFLNTWPGHCDYGKVSYGDLFQAAIDDVLVH